MRTKTLLIAAAALAAGLVSSQAQVYSANVVGYVNYVSTTVSPQFEMIDNPLDNGSNTLKSIIATPPGGTQLQIWQPTSASFLTATYAGGHWRTNSVLADGYVIPPGVGYFISIGSGILTNTFVGTVDPNTGLSGTNVVNTGFQALSSMLPISDNVTNTATVNLIVPGGTQVQKWNVGTQHFDTYVFSGGKWRLNSVVTNLVVGLPEGYFVNNQSGSSFNWVQVGP